MSFAIRIDLRIPLDRFELALAWETDARFLGLFGPSGAGKTTLLEALAGLRPAARGSIEVGGRVWLDSARGISLRPESRGVGYVPQDALLFPHLDVLGNLSIGRGRALASAGARLSPTRVLEVLELTGLEHRSVGALSGGERRRVALARALLSGPELLLLDEPLAGLDAPLRDRVITYLLRVREEFGLPAILVSHDVVETKLFASEVAVLSAGRMLARGSPEEVFLRPGMEGGPENVLRGSVRAVERGAAHVALDGGVEIVTPGQGLTPGAEVRIGIHAEDLMLAEESPARISAQNLVAARIRELREEAGRVLVVVEVGERSLPLAVAITPLARERLALAPGRAVVLVWKAHACRVWVARVSPPGRS